jgi:hypothetical protein
MSQTPSFPGGAGFPESGQGVVRRHRGQEWLPRRETADETADGVGPEWR